MLVKDECPHIKPKWQRSLIRNKLHKSKDPSVPWLIASCFFLLVRQGCFRDILLSVPKKILGEVFVVYAKIACTVPANLSAGSMR